MKKFLYLFLFAPLVFSQTTITTSSTVVQTGIRRAGINFGQNLFYDSQQFTKNMIMSNPAFNDSMYASVWQCGTGTTSSSCSDGNYSNNPAGFWPSGSLVVAQQPSALAGCQSTVTSSNGNLLQTTGTWTAYNAGASCTGSLASGDNLWVRKVITPTSTGYNPLGGGDWQTSTFGAPVISIESTNLPTPTGLTFQRALDVKTTGSGDYYYLKYFFDKNNDPLTGNNFILLNNTAGYTISYWAYNVSGGGTIISTVQRGTTTLYTVTDTITSGWHLYSHTFSASESGAPDTALEVSFVFNASQENYFTFPQLTEGTAIGNNTVFRDSVVQTLQTMKVGSIRFWDGIFGVTATDTIANQLADDGARMPNNFAAGFSTSPGYSNEVQPSYGQQLALCYALNADCHLILPVTTSVVEAGELTDYLGGAAGSTGANIRIAQGQTTPWTTAFSALGLKIWLEVGNETWNGTFNGESYENSLTQGGYAQIAQTIFTAIKASSNYNSTLQLVVGSQYGNPNLVQTTQNFIANNDAMAVAPYTDTTPTDANSPDLWNSYFAEPQVLWNSGNSSSNAQCAESTCPGSSYLVVGGTAQGVYGGLMYLNGIAVANATTPKPLVIYEENYGPSSTNFSQVQMNAAFPTLGSGIEQAEQILTNIQNGVKEQNIFQLGQSEFNGFSSSGGATYFRGWGSVVGIGGPQNRLRTSAVAMQVVNGVISQNASLLTTTQTGTPTYSVGNPATATTINTVATNSVNKVLSYLFNNGSGSYSLVLLNLDQTNTQAVTIAGTIVPTGSTTQTVMNSTNLSDWNETANVVVPTTSTLTSPTSLTLPAHSVTTLAWTSGGGGTLTPANPQVKVGGSISLTGSGNITCPTTGYVGTFSGCGTTAVTYNAPASITPQFSAQNLQIVPNNSIWVTPTQGLPLDAQSATKITALANGGSAPKLSVDYAWSLGLVVAGTTLFTPLSFYLPANTYGSYPDPQFSQFYSGTEQSGRDGISGYSGGNNADHHTVLIDNANIIGSSAVGGWVYEFYDKFLNGAKRTCSGCTAGTYTANTEGNQDYQTASYSLSNGNVNAAGTLLAPLTLTLGDIENGGTHLLSFTACAGCFNYSSHVWPATANLGSGSTCTTCLQFGNILQIPSSQLATLKSTYCTGTAATRCQNILTQLSNYGMMIIDVGISGQINIDPKASLDPLNVAALAEISNIPINSTNFQLVNNSSLEVSATSSESCPINQTCLNGVQSYVTPVSDAWVSVGGTLFPISVQGVSVGLANAIPGFVPTQTGSYSITLPSKVTGASNTAVSWSLVSGSGSVTTSGVYTPPTTVGSVSTTILKVQSNADSTQSSNLILELFPTTTPAQIQDDTNSTTNTTDANSNTWLADLGVENNYFSNNISGYQTSQTPYATQFNSGMSYFGFIRKYYFLPNGNYTASFLIGENQCSGASTCASWIGQYNNLYNLLPLDFEVNGQIQKHQLDPYLQTSYFYSKGNIVTVPATVSNNFLEVGIYKSSPDITAPSYTGGAFLCSACVNLNFAPSTQNNFVNLNGFSLATDSTSAYLGIDVANTQSKVSANSIIAVWPIDGHISLPLGPGTVSWSLLAPVPSGATITANAFDNGATISLPSGTYRSSDLINVKATYGAYSAILSIPIAGTANPLMLLH